MTGASLSYPSIYWVIPVGVAIAVTGWLLLRKVILALSLGLAGLLTGGFVHGKLLHSNVEKWLEGQRVYAILFADFPQDKEQFISEFTSAYRSGGAAAVARKQEEIKIIMFLHHVPHYIDRAHTETLRKYIEAHASLLGALFKNNDVLCNRYMANTRNFSDVWSVAGNDLFLADVRYYPQMIVEATDSPEPVAQGDRARASVLADQVANAIARSGGGDTAELCRPQYQQYDILSQMSPRDGALFLKYFLSEDHLDETGPTSASIDLNRKGYNYLNGAGVSRDPSEARRWYQESADRGDMTGEYQLGWIYAFVDPVNYSEARKWFLKAAAQGSSTAQNNLGWLYLNGMGVPADPLVAKEWYRKSADQGDITGGYQLGWLYMNTEPVNYAEALKWSSKAADKGNAAGQFQVGWIYGHIPPVNYGEAMKWYQKAAGQGNATAQNDIGFLYENGLGVSQDYATAARWYQKAVVAGNARAMFHLANIYDKGSGVPRNTAQGRSLMEKAAAIGDKEALKWLALNTVAPHSPAPH